MTRSTISLLVFLVGIALVLVASSVSAATGKVLRGNTIANNNNNKYAVSSTNRGRRAPQLGRPDAGVVMPDFDNFDAIKAAVESYDTYPMATSSAQNPQYKITPIDTVINNQLVHGHVTTLSNPIGHYNIMPSPHGCPGALQVSTSASYYGCEVAYNAGFFDLITQTCIGNIISNGKVVQMQSTNYNGVQFGTTASGDYVIGYLNNTEIENLKLTNLVGGNMWLVRNGASYIDTAISIERPGYDFIWEKAPRNAIGFNAKGELLLIEVDGDEALHFGLDLYEFTQVVLSTGVLYALNMDGGGSTTAYVNGTVINQPSDFCPDGINRCERFVTTISCIKNF